MVNKIPGLSMHSKARCLTKRRRDYVQLIMYNVIILIQTIIASMNRHGHQIKTACSEIEINVYLVTKIYPNKLCNENNNCIFENIMVPDTNV